MRGGTTPLLVVISVLWLLILLVTQVLTDPPLDARWAIGVGLLLTDIAIIGYGSQLRGPRSPLRRPRNGNGRERTGEQRTIAALGRRMPYLRQGLTVETARRTADLLLPLLGSHSVGFTDDETLLTLVGAGEDHHRPGDPLDPLTERVLRTQRTALFRRERRLKCAQPDCPLVSGVIAPLVVNGAVVGSLLVFRTDHHAPSKDMVEGMAGILSLHLELGGLDLQRQLAVDAKLSALRAQINPHFLFNTLNTIASKARTDPDAARELLLRLADFFRYAIRQDGQFAEFAQEYFFVRTYLALEQARFGERLRIRYDIDPQVLGVRVPVLVIQPLVENAVKHGLADKVGGGTVTLRARVDPLARCVNIQVRDDGVGIQSEQLGDTVNGDSVNGSHANGGIGLSNISERLATLFDDRYRMEVDSRPGRGTTVNLNIPIN